MDDPHGELEPSAHSARIRLHEPVGGGREVHLGQEVSGVPFNPGAGKPVEPGFDEQVLAPRELLVCRRFLEYEADLPSDVVGSCEDIDPFDASSARRSA